MLTLIHILDVLSCPAWFLRIFLYNSTHMPPHTLDISRSLNKPTQNPLWSYICKPRLRFDVEFYGIIVILLYCITPTMFHCLTSILYYILCDMYYFVFFIHSNFFHFLLLFQDNTPSNRYLLRKALPAVSYLKT